METVDIAGGVQEGLNTGFSQGINIFISAFTNNPWLILVFGLLIVVTYLEKTKNKKNAAIGLAICVVIFLVCWYML